ncbi:MAG: hypothetical protein HYX55_02470 [Chloroflexi bacterium]|nr:hypothetical protein [Chloroflexota bacterium]
MTGLSGPPKARPGREPESAAFQAARVVRERGRPPAFVLGFFVVIAALVVVGVGGRSSATPTPPPVAIGSPAGTARPTVPSSPAPTVPAFRPDASLAAGPVVRSGPGPIQLESHRLSTSMYVHGDVFVANVTWVYVSLQDNRGRVAGWASVSVPGSAGPPQGDGPTLRFDVDVGVPAGFEGPLRINANAYDADGALMASTRLDIDSLLRSREDFEP